MVARATLRVIAAAAVVSYAGLAHATFDLSGKTVTIYVAGGVGGGVDLYARSIAPYFTRYLPGKPSVTVSNMPGAGGAQAVQYLYNVADKDGSAIGTTNVGPVAQPFLEDIKANYELNKFEWVGSLTKGKTVCATWHEVGVNTIEEARKRTITVATTGARSSPTRSALLMNTFLGTQFKPIAGYTGGTALIALERGEVDATCTTLNSLRTTRPQWLAEGKLKILVHVAMQADPEYSQVPSALDFIENPIDKAALEFYLLPNEFNNPFYLPPGVPADAVAAWRKAFDAAVADPEYLADAKKRGQDVETENGEAVAKLVERMYAAPPEVVARTRAAVTVTDPLEQKPSGK